MYVSRRTSPPLEVPPIKSRVSEALTSGNGKSVTGLGALATAIVASRATGLPDDYFPMAAIGVSFMVAAFLLQVVWPRHLYVLVLRTSSGDVDALTSHKKKLVSNARQALEQAFMIRAGQAASSAALGSEAAIRQALEVAARASHETMPRY